MAKFTKEERQHMKQFEDGYKDVMSGGMDRLSKQFEKGIGVSRYNLKKESGHAQLDIITSEKSLEKYKSAFSTFAHWCKKEGIERFHLVTQDDVERFLYYQEAIGQAYPTITGYQTALNHAYYGSGVPGHPRYSAHHLGIKNDKTRRNNLLTAPDKPQLPDKHRYHEQAELARMSGLRRDELERVGTKSFYEVNGDYYIAVVGKNGRPRYAEVLESGKEKFKKRYSDCIIRVDSKKEIPQTKEAIYEIYRTQTELYDHKIPNKYRMHVYRALYAQEFYRELKANDNYSKEDTRFKLSEEYEGDTGLFRKISKSLGHNRVDTQLMASYLRDK